MQQPDGHRSLRAPARDKRALRLPFFLFLLLFLPTAPALAETEPSSQAQNPLHAIAQQFANKIGTGLKKADDALSGHDNYAENLTGMEDGEILILKPALEPEKKRLVRDFRPQDALIGIKQGDAIFIDLTEFARIVGFKITFDAENKVAEGSTYRENETFRLDLNTGDVAINGAPAPALAANEYLIDGDTVFIDPARLSAWFDLKIQSNPRSLGTIITTSRLTPTQERLVRQERRLSDRAKTAPVMPPIEQPAHVFSAPRLDVSLSQDLRQRTQSNGTTETSARSTYNVTATNEIAGHETQTFISGTDETPFNSMRVTFRKDSKEDNLLGPLKARVYEFNDITTVVVPRSGGGGLERGLRVSNRSNRYTVDTETSIDGTGLPGWDVELYRNNAFVDGTIIDDSGYFFFENIQLFAGDNNLKIIQYGPMGEVREEDRILTVTTTTPGGIKGFYNLSLSQKDEITYRANKRDGEDTGSLRLAGTYDHRLSDNLTVRAGLHSRQTFGQRDNYLYSGAALRVGQVFYNADVSATSDGPFSSSLQMRRRLGTHNVAGGLSYRSQGFSTAYIDDTNSHIPSAYAVNVSLAGPWFPETFARTNYNASLSYNKNDEGYASTNAGLNMTSYFMGLRFNNRLSATTTSGAGTTAEDRLDYSGSVFGRYKKTQWQLSSSYSIKPEAEPKTAEAQINHRFARNLNGTLNLHHDFQDAGLTQVSASLGYTTEKARYSPTISYDSDNNWRAYLGVNFSLVKDPHDSGFVMTSRRVGRQGGLSVLTFLDKNADGLFNEDDTALSDVTVVMPQMNRRLTTDKNGRAFAYNLSTARPTDIIIEENSSFDINWVSGVRGLSFQPRPADIAQVEFPVVRGAEIDGTVYLPGRSGALDGASNITLRLVSPDGTISRSQTTPFDGFYVFERVYPGIWYLTTDSRTANTPAYSLPQKIVITPEGAILYGNDITLTRGQSIPFTFSATNSNPAAVRRIPLLRPEDIAREDVFIRLGDYRSSLSLTLDWYKLRLKTRGWDTHLSPLAADMNDIPRDTKSGKIPFLLKSSQPLDMQSAALLCERLLAEAGFPSCGVEVVTTFNSPAADVEHPKAKAEAAAVTAGSG